MRILKLFAAASVLAFCGISASAQDCCGEGCKEAQDLGYKPYPYNFIQVQGGANTVFTNVNSFKLLSPTASVGIGRMFSPIVGARVHVNAWEARSGFDKLAKYYPGESAYNQEMGAWEILNDPMKYRFNYINTNLDLMVNVINIFSKNCHHAFDLYAIAGVGLNYAWHNHQFENITNSYEVADDISNAWGPSQSPRHQLLGHNLRLGLLADYNISKNVSIGAEVNFNSLDDRFDSKYGDSDDWMMTAQLSLTYKFGFKKVTKPTPPPVIIQKEAEPAKVETPAPAPKVETPKAVVEEPIKETIFYAIRESDVETQSIINRVVAWCKKYPNKTITVDGYADKGTGNPTLNVGYAKARAEKVADILQKQGVSASQMKVSSYGDTVQPFPENDKNRCVIIEGK